jgi:16S rRNA (uracil1498-N3)-methyltransferase
MNPRFHVDLPLQADQPLSLPPSAARHVQVLRLQPGAAITLFNGQGGEWQAEVLRMGRSGVEVKVLTHLSAQREMQLRVSLAIVMPANDRMDGLVEKATELGVAAIQPLMSDRSVLRLSGDRAQKKVPHWQGVAVAACEQSGRTHVPPIGDVMSLSDWLKSLAPVTETERRCVLSLRDAQPWQSVQTQLAAETEVRFLSGPEGGLSEAEEALARQHGFVATSLGPRVLRADTAPLAVLAALSLSAPT